MSETELPKGRLIIGNGIERGTTSAREEGIFVLPRRAGRKAALCTVLILGNGIDIGAVSLVLPRRAKRTALSSLLRDKDKVSRGDSLRRVYGIRSERDVTQ